MARRTGRNEAFNHGGNVVAAALAGSLADQFGYGAMFLLVAGMAAASSVTILLIRETDVDHAASPAELTTVGKVEASPSASSNCSKTGESPPSPLRWFCSISPTPRCFHWSARRRATVCRKGRPS